MLNSIFGTTTTETTISITNLIYVLAAAFAFGIAISLVHRKTQKNSASQSFSLTLAVLPAVVAVIILLVGSNIARAFSLAGAFSIIRFRSAPGDSKDITYVLFSMAVGLATGMGFLAYAAAITAAFGSVMLVLELINFGGSKGSVRTLKISVPENLNYETEFTGVFGEFLSSSKLHRVRTTDLGSLYEAMYVVELKPTVSEKEFIDKLRCINGNLPISLISKTPTGEF